MAKYFKIVGWIEFISSIVGIFIGFYLMLSTPMKGLDGWWVFFYWFLFLFGCFLAPSIGLLFVSHGKMLEYGYDYNPSFEPPTNYEANLVVKNKTIAEPSATKDTDRVSNAVGDDEVSDKQQLTSTTVSFSGSNIKVNGNEYNIKYIENLINEGDLVKFKFYSKEIAIKCKNIAEATMIYEHISKRRAK